MSEIGAFLLLPLGLLVAVIVDSLLLVALYRARRGRFEVVQDDEQSFVALTNVGRVTIDRSAGVLAVGAAPPVALSRLERLDYNLRSDWASTEELLMGFDIWDVWKGYQDKLHWHTVAVCPVDGARIPLFVTGEFEPREPILNSSGFLEWQLSALARLGWIELPGADALSVVDRLQIAFRESGVELSLASRAATERASSERRITMR